MTSSSAPQLSVVVPARNVGRTIGDQLSALAAQRVDFAWEVVVADNGSVDDTRSVVDRAGYDLPALRVVDASGGVGPSFARNCGARAATGRLLAFIDADDLVLPGWLASCRDLLDQPEVLATGPTVRFSTGTVPVAPSSAPRNPPRHMGLEYVDTANLVIARALFYEAGGFDERRLTGEDVDLSWRLARRGVAISWVAGAAVAVRWADERSSLRQYFRYGRTDPFLYRDFPDLGPTPVHPKAVAKSYAGIVARLPLLWDRDQRFKWSHQAGRRAGRLVGSIEARTLYL